MVVEARRVGVSLVWLYIIGGFLIAISVTFPLFMIAREMRSMRWLRHTCHEQASAGIAPSAVVAEIARRHNTRAQQVHGWRRDAREGRLVLPAGAASGELVSFADNSKLNSFRDLSGFSLLRSEVGSRVLGLAHREE